MTPDSVPAGDLARLLDTERRLGERLQSARAEAEAVVAHARAAAEQREAALATQLETEQRRMGERLERERRKREREIADAAQREVETYQRVTRQRLAEIARALAPRLLDEEGSR
jgi:vacuolar-type H+-ATPase subunit H